MEQIQLPGQLSIHIQGESHTFTGGSDQTAYKECVKKRTELEDRYGWIIEGKWYLADVQTLLDAGQALEQWFLKGGASDPSTND